MHYTVPQTLTPSIEAETLAIVLESAKRMDVIPMLSVCCDQGSYKIYGDGVRRFDDNNKLIYTPFTEMEKNSETFLLQGALTHFATAIKDNAILGPILRDMGRNQHSYRSFAEIILTSAGMLIVFDDAGNDMLHIERNKALDNDFNLTVEDVKAGDIAPSQQTFALCHHAIIFDDKPENEILMENTIKTLVVKYLTQSAKTWAKFVEPPAYADNTYSLF